MQISAQSKQVRHLSLQDAIVIANDSSLTAFRYRNMYLSSYWEYVSYKAGRLPSLTLQLTPIAYNRYMVERYDSQLDMDIFRRQQSYSASGGLSIQQNVDFLGGTLYVDGSIDYLENFGAARYRQYSSVPFRIGYRQSLLGYNPFKWERRIEPLKFQKARRNFISNLEELSGQVAEFYFNVLLTQQKLDLARRNKLASDTLLQVGERRFGIAAISKADLLTLQLDAVNAQTTLHNAQQAYQRALTSFISYLGLENDSELQLSLPNPPRMRELTAEAALRQARLLNPKFLAQRQSVIEAKQEVDHVRKELYVNASFNASVGFNQVAETFHGAFRSPMEQDLVALSLTIPIVDWGVRKGKLSMARSNLAAVESAAQKEAIDLEQDVVMTVGDFISQQAIVENAALAMDLAQQAYEQTRQRFMIGKADVNAVTLASNRKDTAFVNYLSVMQTWWSNYFKLRQITLYDFNMSCPLEESFNFDTGLYL